MAKIISIYAKCSDLFNMSIVDTETGKTIVDDYDGYVPRCAFGGGDDVQMDIDAETGRILNWKNPLEDEDFCEEAGIINPNVEYSWIVTLVDEKNLPTIRRIFGTEEAVRKLAQEEFPDLEIESVEIDN